MQQNKPNLEPENPYSFVACTISTRQKFGQGTEGMACLQDVWSLRWGVTKARADSSGWELESSRRFFPFFGTLAGLPVWTPLPFAPCGLTLAAPGGRRVRPDSQAQGSQSRSSSKQDRSPVTVHGSASEGTLHFYPRNGSSSKSTQIQGEKRHVHLSGGRMLKNLQPYFKATRITCMVGTFFLQKKHS